MIIFNLRVAQVYGRLKYCLRFQAVQKPEYLAC
jgi:hypothetical protein